MPNFILYKKIFNEPYMQDLEKNMSDSSQLIHSQILYQTTILTNKLTLFHIFVQSPQCIGFHIEYGTSAHKLPH